MVAVPVIIYGASTLSRDFGGSLSDADESSRLPATARAAREASQQSFTATIELRDAARRNRLAHWDTAQRLIQEAAALAPPKLSAVGR